MTSANGVDVLYPEELTKKLSIQLERRKSFNIHRQLPIITAFDRTRRVCRHLGTRLRQGAVQAVHARLVQLVESYPRHYTDPATTSSSKTSASPRRYVRTYVRDGVVG